jgi:hypothetical protein
MAMTRQTGVRYLRKAELHSLSHHSSSWPIELDAFFLVIHHSQSEWISFRKAFLGLSW